MYKSVSEKQDLSLKDKKTLKCLYKFPPGMSAELILKSHAHPNVATLDDLICELEEVNKIVKVQKLSDVVEKSQIQIIPVNMHLLSKEFILSEMYKKSQWYLT